MSEKNWDNPPSGEIEEIPVFVSKARQKEEHDWYGTLDEKPPTEQELFRLQDEYLNHGRDIKVWSRMLVLCYNYTRSLLLKRLRGEYHPPEEVAAAAGNAALEFMRQYQTNRYFVVGASFAGLIRYKIIGARAELRAPAQTLPSLNALVSTDGAKEEVSEVFDKLGMKTITDISSMTDPEYFVNKIDISSEVNHIISEAVAELKDNPRMQILMMCYIVIVLRGPTNRHAKEVFLKTFVQEERERWLLDTAVTELYRRVNCIDA